MTYLLLIHLQGAESILEILDFILVCSLSLISCFASCCLATACRHSRWKNTWRSVEHLGVRHCSSVFNAVSSWHGLDFLFRLLEVGELLCCRNTPIFLRTLPLIWQSFQRSRLLQLVDCRILRLLKLVGHCLQLHSLLTNLCSHLLDSLLHLLNLKFFLFKLTRMLLSKPELNLLVLSVHWF